MSSREMDLSLLLEVIEVIFEPNALSADINRIFTKERLEIAHYIERKLTMLCAAVGGSAHPAPEDVAYMNKLQQLLSALKNGLYEVEAGMRPMVRFFRSPSIFSAGPTLFSRGSVVTKRKNFAF